MGDAPRDLTGPVQAGTHSNEVAQPFDTLICPRLLIARQNRRGRNLHLLEVFRLVASPIYRSHERPPKWELSACR